MTEDSGIDPQVQLTILQHLKSRKEGISTTEISNFTPQLTNAQRTELINSILATGEVEMSTEQTSGTVILKYQNCPLSTDAPQEERLTYSLIEESSQTGIWIRELRDQSGLSDAQLRRVLKSLEHKKLIKSIKPVGTSKKCYILYNVNAHDNLTGGTFYSNQQFDSSFVGAIMQICVAMLQGRRNHALSENPHDKKRQIEESFVTSEVVAKYVHEKKVFTVELSVKDVETVLDIAVLEGKLEKRFENQYRARNASIPISPMVTVPCFQCPVSFECRPGHVISPETCEYLQKVFDI